MCGILGVYLPGGLASSPGHLRNLTHILDHRGPDSSGTKTLHGAAFGHTRLSILGLDDPMSSQPVHVKNCLLSFNGEIYNFRELGQQLREEGVPCGEKSDTEVLFHGLCHWGIEKTLSRLDGMFAFAFYDGERRILHLARDRLGEKPLYWACNGNSLCFASEIKVLLASGDIRPSPNLARIDDFFYTGLVNGTQTMFEQVRELSPGTFLTIGEDQPEPVLTAFWSLEETEPELVSQSMDAWGDTFLELLDWAITSRRVSDVPIGILLSGGIDSNSIAERLMDADGTPPPFFFADSIDPASSESADVNAFLDHQRLKHPGQTLKLFTETPDLSSFLNEHIRLTWHFDEPMVFLNAISLSAICRRAREQNIKVLLSGEGSDEILYGYDRFTRTADQLSGLSDTDTIFRSVYMGGGEHNANVIERLCAGRAEGERQTEPWQWLEKHGKALSLPKLQLLFNQKFRLLSLLHRQDRVGMSHGIECRIPFLAPKLVRWVNRLPFSAKYESESGRTKYLLRHVMAHRLPERILTKPKDGFPSGIESCFRKDRLKSVIESLVGNPDGFLNTYLDGEFAQRILADYFSGQTRYEFLVWRFFNLEIWHRIFCQGHPLENRTEACRRVFESLPAAEPEWA